MFEFAIRAFNLQSERNHVGRGWGWCWNHAHESEVTGAKAKAAVGDAEDSNLEVRAGHAWRWRAWREVAMWQRWDIARVVACGSCGDGWQRVWL